MEKTDERRREQRLDFQWPIWHAEGFGKTLSQGQIVDISSGGAAFTCGDDPNCPYPGQKLTSRFSVPHVGADGSCGMVSFTRAGLVCRVDNVDKFSSRIAIQFAEPLPFRPAEQLPSQADMQRAVKSIVI